MVVWVRGDRLHALDSHWSGSRSGFSLHKVCTFPASGLRPGAKQHAQRVCDRRVNSSHLVSKAHRGVTSIQGDRDAKDNQSQQETEWLKSLIVASRCRLDIKRSLTRLSLAQFHKVPKQEYHRSSDKMEYLLLWHMETGRQPWFQSTRKTGGSTLQTLCMSCKHFGVAPEYGPQPRRTFWAFDYY